MAFARFQGGKISILHSKRVSGRVRQLKLHVFDRLPDASGVVASNESWDRFCDDVEMAQPEPLKLDRLKLRGTIMAILHQEERKDQLDPLGRAVTDLASTLLSIEKPFTPAQERSLRAAEGSLRLLRLAVGQKLEQLDSTKEKEMLFPETTGNVPSGTAEELFDRGLEHYEAGEWEQAKTCFLQGLRKDPRHVDLLVHAGLSCLIDHDLHLALGYFDKAASLGKLEADALIEANPDDYVKLEDRKARAEQMVCDLADECPDFNTRKCVDCEDSPQNQLPNLYGFMKFRPFFRALSNRAITLMRLGRYQAAIETLLLSETYDHRWGIHNMIGECYLCMEELEEAERWYREMLWPDAFYVRSLILFALDRHEDSMRYLLTGVTHNWHIGRTLIGTEKLEPVRHVGDALPLRLAASEFNHEKGLIFKKYPAFRTMLRCVLENPEIDQLLEDLAESYRRWKEERDFRMDGRHWDIMHGNMNEGFLDEHVPRLLERFNDKGGEYWTPKPGQLIAVKVEEKKKTNWLVSLADTPEKQLYFRPTGTSRRTDHASTIQVKVAKSWHYRKRLFVTGQITP